LRGDEAIRCKQFRRAYLPGPSPTCFVGLAYARQRGDSGTRSRDVDPRRGRLGTKRDGAAIALQDMADALAVGVPINLAADLPRT
jgi:hypothetical protein